MKDGLGVEITAGDAVTVMHYGWAARLIDTGRRVTVTGFTPQGNVKHDGGNYGADVTANGRAIRPGCLAVNRRDGLPGYEANR